MIIPVNFAQVNFEYGGLAAPTGAANTLGIGELASTDPEELANAAIAAWTDNIAALVVNDLTLTSVLVKLGPNSTGGSARVGSGQTGAAGGAGMTPQNSLLIRKTVFGGGRSRKGRMFLPGITEGTADESGQIVSGTVAIYQAGFNDFYDQLVATVGTPYLLHSSSSDPDEIQGFAVQSLMATQRRRIRR